MSLLRRMMHRIGSNTGAIAEVPRRSHLLDAMAEEGSPGSLTVLAIRNGFLIARRTYNPSGPDRIDATFAANAEDLGPQIIAELAQLRLTK
jgi:hypothetical protein